MFKDRKILIFETMEQILSEDGYESLTYANISSRCHLHTTTITYYFNDKEDMLIQFFEYLVIKGNRELPVFYSSIPSDTPPVESFFHLIDHILDGEILRSRARRLLNQLLLPLTDNSSRVQNFLHRVQLESSEIEYSAINLYRSIGLIDEKREQAAFSDLTLVSAGYSLINLFTVECVGADYALLAARHRIKKSFLKDEYHPLIVPKLPCSPDASYGLLNSWF